MDPELDVRAVAGRYLAALVAGDPVRTISLMSPKAQAELLDAARREGYAAETALDAATEWFARWRAVFAAVFAEDEIDVVDVVEDDATATYRHPDDENPDPDDTFVLRRIDGEWLIDAFPDDDDPGGPPPA